MNYLLFNGLLFNLSWFAIVYTHSDYLAVGIAAAHILVHFSVMGYGLPEFRLVSYITFFGVLFDQAMFASGVFSTANGNPFAPLWLSCLWPILGTTLMHAFRGLQHNLLLAMILGGVGGAASYTLGARLSDIDFTDPAWGLRFIAITWAIVFPSMLLIARSEQFREVNVHVT